MIEISVLLKNGLSKKNKANEIIATNDKNNRLVDSMQ
jgi:hypothetical protein